MGVFVNLLPFCSSCGKTKTSWTSLKRRSASKGTAHAHMEVRHRYAVQCSHERHVSHLSLQGRRARGGRRSDRLLVLWGGVLHHWRDHHSDRRDRLPTLKLQWQQICPCACIDVCFDYIFDCSSWMWTQHSQNQYRNLNMKANISQDSEAFNIL